MSVSITFEPLGISGLVAEGTYLIDAARRMGAPLGAGCTRGKNQCPACGVRVRTSTTLLSMPSEIERKWLGSEQLAQGLRMVCQVKLESQGELVLEIAAPKPRYESSQDELADVRKRFGDLPLQQKIATLVQLEAVTMSEAFNAAIEKPKSFGARALDSIVARARSARAQARQKKEPPDHHDRRQ